MENSATPWTRPDWQQRTQLLLDSYRHWLKSELIDCSGDVREDARRLFDAPCVVVAHDTASDPLLNYANSTALTLWETDLDTLIGMPSRLTAEPLHRDERARMLAASAQDGFIRDYRGIRITARGRRFRIERAVVWNLIDTAGRPAGQAATFQDWVWL